MWVFTVRNGRDGLELVVILAISRECNICQRYLLFIGSLIPDLL